VKNEAPYLEWQGKEVGILPGVVSGTVAASHHNTLAVCHNQFNGDAASFSSFTGQYVNQSGPLFIANNASCLGLAYGKSRGLLAYHALESPGKCCSRAMLVEVDDHGKQLTKPEPALGPSEFENVRVTDYANGFAWASILNNTPPTVRIGFRKGSVTTTQEVEVLEYDGIAPQITSWPFGKGVALTFGQENRWVRMLIVEESGNTVLDTKIVPEEGERIFRAPVASSPRGVFTSYLKCPADFSKKNGMLVVELRQDPSHPTFTQPNAIEIPTMCPGSVTSMVVLRDLVFVITGSEDGVMGTVFKILELLDNSSIYFCFGRLPFLSGK
jgi:hypothetical protein